MLVEGMVEGKNGLVALLGEAGSVQGDRPAQAAGRWCSCSGWLPPEPTLSQGTWDLFHV